MKTNSFSFLNMSQISSHLSILYPNSDPHHFSISQSSLCSPWLHPLPTPVSPPQNYCNICLKYRSIPCSPTQKSLVLTNLQCLINTMPKVLIFTFIYYLFSTIFPNFSPATTLICFILLSHKSLISLNLYYGAFIRMSQWKHNLIF